MFERFTERARQVVVLAQEEARTLKHNYIGTEHILLGLLREQDGLAARALEELGVTVERVRAQIVRIVGTGEEETSGQIPFTPRAKKTLELTQRESRSLGHNYIGTEHILLGLISVKESVGIRILADFDADADTVRNDLLRLLSTSNRVTHQVGAPAISSVHIRHGNDVAWLGELGPVLNQIGVEIRAKLRRDPDIGDLLLVLACAPKLLPAQALSELGVDLDALWGALERARAQAAQAQEQTRRERQQRTEQIHELRVAKEQAIEAQQFEHAAGLRDQERRLVEAQAHADQARTPEDDVLQEIRRRLGIPHTENPPQPPSEHLDPPS